jgi:hypothetical protein
MVETVQNWGDAVLISITDALRNFLGFLPALVGAILILTLGWILSGILAGVVERLLKTVGFERASETAGIAAFVRRSGSGWTASKVVAEIVKWFIRLVAIQAAAQILGMGQITQIINSILLFLPNLVVALAIVVLGAFIANFVSGLVRGTVGEMGFSNPDLIASVARYAIIVFAVVAAVDQLGIAETVVNTLLIGTVAAVALALGLAFGLGGQQTAAQIAQGWYEQGRKASQKVAQAAGDATATSAQRPRAPRPLERDKAAPAEPRKATAWGRGGAPALSRPGSHRIKQRSTGSNARLIRTCLAPSRCTIPVRISRSAITEGHCRIKALTPDRS